MKSKLKKRDVLPWLEPPSGGLSALRARLDSPRRRPLIWAAAAAATTAAVILAVVAITYATAPSTVVPRPDTTSLRPLAEGRHATPGPAGPTLDLRRHPALAAVPAEPVTVPHHARGRVAVTRAAPDSPDVLFYWVSPHTDRRKSR